jgi:hypothetical protein
MHEHRVVTLAIDGRVVLMEDALQGRDASQIVVPSILTASLLDDIQLYFIDGHTLPPLG